jgi:hypothetical protein
MLDGHPSLKMKGKASIAAKLREKFCVLLRRCDQDAERLSPVGLAVSFR